MAALTLALACGLAAAPSAAARGGDAPLRAGAAQADLTPPVGTPLFAYTGRSRLANPSHLPGLVDHVVGFPDPTLYAKTFVPSEGIHTRVRARAVVLERRGVKYALVQADLGGLPHTLTREVVRRVRHTGISEERLLLTATHTHASTGPIWPGDHLGYALLGGDLFDPRVYDRTVAAIAEAILAADARLEPARAGVATHELRGASRNRSFAAFRRNADVPRDPEGARAASVDPTVTVVRIDSAGGRPLAVWSSFAIHPTSFGADNALISADNAGVAERVVEAALAKAGGTGAVSVWANGAEGDVAPDGSPDADGGEPLQWAPNAFASTHLAGERVGRGILAAWKEAGKRLADDLELATVHTLLAFDGTPADGRPVGPVPALGLAGVFGPDGLCSPIEDLAGPGQGRKFPLLAGLGLVPSTAPVAVWRIGGLVVVALPTEVTKQMGERIRAAVAREGFEQVAIAGLANGYLSYTATPEEYDACLYEGSFTLFGRHQGPRYRDVAVRLARRLEEAGAVGAGEAPAARPAAGGGIALPPAPVRVTPRAGEVVAQPQPAIDRFGRAQFRWRGGDPALDAPRGGAFVTLERETADGWTAVGSDDHYRDITVRERGDVWRETWQFSACDPTGRYRFRVRGRADRGGGPRPYEVVSAPFEVRRLTGLRAEPPVVSRGRVRVRATYPDPGKDVLLALPRRVRSGWVELRVTPRGGRPRRVRARPDARRLAFEARVPAGARVEVVRVRDRCGNTGR